MSLDGDLRIVTIAFALRGGATVWLHKRRQLARKPKQLTSPVAKGRATGAYNLSLEVFRSDSRRTVLSSGPGAVTRTVLVSFFVGSAGYVEDTVSANAWDPAFVDVTLDATQRFGAQ